MQIEAAIIGGGPAGLMAAEALSVRGYKVHLFDAMPSLGRKFLMAGKSGLNLTHAEPFDAFLEKFGAATAVLEPALRNFPPQAISVWAEALGAETFVGSSGRVFPKSMKAAPLLRAWLRRLREQGVITHVRHKWTGWSPTGTLLFETPEGQTSVKAITTVLALGGGSWPTLGSDAAWIKILGERDIAIHPLEPANCGFNVNWSDHFKERFAGSPVKSVSLCAGGKTCPGEFVVTKTGIEGGGVYTHSSALREELKGAGAATLFVDLTPNISEEKLRNKLSRPQGSRSFSTHLKKTVGLSGVKAGLLRECAPDKLSATSDLVQAIKKLPITLQSARPLVEAISSAGGIVFDELNDGFMLNNLPGVFCAGEMLDWEAPTGGYLLSTCFATGLAAGNAAAAFLETSSSSQREQ